MPLYFRPRVGPFVWSPHKRPRTRMPVLGPVAIVVAMVLMGLACVLLGMPLIVPVVVGAWCWVVNEVRRRQVR